MAFAITFIVGFVATTLWISSEKKQLTDRLTDRPRDLSLIRERLRRLIGAYGARCGIWVSTFIAGAYLLPNAIAPWMVFLLGIAACDDLRTLLDHVKTRRDLR